MLIPNIKRFGDETSVLAEETAASELTGSTEESNKKISSFTQEQVNDIVAKESAKATEKLLKSLGFEGEGKAKEQVSAFKNWLNSQKTESEKMQENLKDAMEKNHQLKEEIAKASAQNTCLKLGVKPDCVDDVVILANAANEEDMETAVKNVLKRHPSFTLSGTAAPPASPAMPEKATYEQMLMEARKAGNVLQTSMIISEAAAKRIYLR